MAADDTKPHVNDDKVDEHHLTHLLTDRAPLLAEANRIEAELKKFQGQINDTLRAGGTKRHQMMTGPFAGTMVYVVEPKPRKTVVPEKLLALGVSPDIIRAATDEAPQKPYVRVDAPGSTKEQRDARTMRPFDPGAAEPEPAVADDADRYVQ